MTSQDDLALLRQMHERGEITEEQYDTLRRHVLWGTPLPDPDDVPAPRSGADPVGGYVPGAAAVGPDRRRYAAPPDHPTGAPDPPGPPARRYASRRERREAEEAEGRRRAPGGSPRPAYSQDYRAADHPPPATYPTRDDRPPRDSTGPLRADPPPVGPPPVGPPPVGPPPVGPPPDDPPYDPTYDGSYDAPYDPPDDRLASGSTGPLPPVGDPPRRHRHRERARTPDAAAGLESGRRHRRLEQAAPLDQARARRLAEPEPEPDRHGGEETSARNGKRAKAAKKRPRRRSVVAVLTSVVLALALAAGGVYWFELRRAGLPPTTYARQACGTVRDWQQAVDSSNATLIGEISRQQDKATIRSDVTAYFTTIAGRTDQLRVAILDVGAADLPGGREYADSLAAAVGDQADGLRRLAGQAARLDPAAATFPTDLQGILTGADAAVSAVSAALARPAAGITTELRTTLSNEPACVPYVG